MVFIDEAEFNMRTRKEDGWAKKGSQQHVSVLTHNQQY